MHSNKDLDWLINTETQSNEEEKSKINPKAKRAMSIVGDSEGRPTDDYYCTPKNAVEALLKVEQFQGNIWENCCGNGSISEVLINHGYEVISTELSSERGYGIGGHDFFTSELVADNIVTNPPYNLSQRWVERSLEKTTGKVALLLKLSFLEGVARQKMFKKVPLARVHIFSKRLSMYRNGQQDGRGSGMIAFAWFIFEHGHVGSPTIHWL